MSLLYSVCYIVPGHYDSEITDVEKAKHKLRKWKKQLERQQLENEEKQRVSNQNCLFQPLYLFVPFLK